ncbi:MAG: hypothetical protein R3E31_05535 [Chloroflexota bacterium]
MIRLHIPIAKSRLPQAGALYQALTMIPGQMLFAAARHLPDRVLLPEQDGCQDDAQCASITAHPDGATSGVMADKAITPTSGICHSVTPIHTPNAVLIDSTPRQL